MARIINNYKKNYRKAEEFCRLLKHFAEKDYEFLFIEEVAKCDNAESIGFYLKCRNIIIDSFLNKTKKELLANVYGNEGTFPYTQSNGTKSQRKCLRKCAGSI